MDKKILEEIEYSKRYGLNFSILLLDIDNFKQINDRFGHDIGDKVLKEVANILQSNIRETDIVGRWGGEEFLIICPNTPAENALQISEKIRMLIDEHTFAVNQSVTVSIGISDYDHASTLLDLFRQADNALYKAKNSGKNCSVTHTV